MFKYSKYSIRSLFLIDAFGALLSFLLSGLVYPSFSSFFGIDSWIFKTFAMLALTFLIFDLTIYFKVFHIRKWMVETIIFFNLSYCVLNALLMWLLPNITNLGLVLLLVENLVIISIVFFEVKLFQSNKYLE